MGTLEHRGRLLIRRSLLRSELMTQAGWKAINRTLSVGTSVGEEEETYHSMDLHGSYGTVGCLIREGDQFRC